MSTSGGVGRSETSGGDWLMATLVAVGLACVYWWPLLLGGGLVGGDTYPYFLPQKQLLTDEFAAGRIPLWHDRTALGYPLLAESQGAVFYPFTQLLYRVCDAHTAYHVNLLIHYVLAALFAWRFARNQGLQQPTALFVAMVFVYGWFPARSSLEWSIVGGVWFPLCLWLTDRLIRRPTFFRLMLLSAALGCHLLAGHFTLAFITQLTCLAWSLMSGSDRTVGLVERPGDSPWAAWRMRLRPLGSTSLALVLALLLASVQLLPTLELQRSSQRDGQRDGQGKVFNPGYGHLPPVYVTQLLASWWYWHTPELIQTRAMLQTPLQSPADTNAVEAHFYIGLLPFGLCLCLLNSAVRQRVAPGIRRSWLLLTILSTFYAFGWLVPLFRHLPGFGFFMGPGRYTIVGTMGLSLMAGACLEVLLRRRSRGMRLLVVLSVAGLTFVDLQWSSRAVSDAVVVSNPPWQSLGESWLGRELRRADEEFPVRVLAPGPNVANLFGVSSVPQYLGLGPAAYFGESFQLPGPDGKSQRPCPDPQLEQRLRGFAVTHVLTTDPIPFPATSLELVGAGPDEFLNRVWGRGGAPCFLYKFRDPPARIELEPQQPTAKVQVMERRPGSLKVQVEADQPGQLVVRDLNMPGWEVTVERQVDGDIAGTEKSADEPAQDRQSTVAPGDFRRVVPISAGRSVVTWHYQPKSVWYGAILSSGTGLCLLLFQLVSAWHRRLDRRGG